VPCLRAKRPGPSIAYRQDVTSGRRARDRRAGGPQPRGSAVAARPYGRNDCGRAAGAAWRGSSRKFQDVLVVLLLVATAISAGLVGVGARRGAPLRGHRDLRRCPAQRGVMGYVQESRAEPPSRPARMSPRCHGVRAGERPPRRRVGHRPGRHRPDEEGDTIPADAAIEWPPPGGRGRVDGRERRHQDTAPIADEVPGRSAQHGVQRHGGNLRTRQGSHRTACAPRWPIRGLLEATPTEVTPLQRELDRTGKILLSWLRWQSSLLPDPHRRRTCVVERCSTC